MDHILEPTGEVVATGDVNLDSTTESTRRPSQDNAFETASASKTDQQGEKIQLEKSNPPYPQLLSAFNFGVKNSSGGLFIETKDVHEEKRKKKKKRVDSTSRSSSRETSSGTNEGVTKRKRSKYGDPVSDSLDHHRRRMHRKKKRRLHRRAKSQDRRPCSAESSTSEEAAGRRHWPSCECLHQRQPWCTTPLPRCSCMMVPLCRVYCQSCGISQFQTCSTNPSTSTADYMLMKDGFSRLRVDADAARSQNDQHGQGIPIVIQRPDASNFQHNSHATKTRRDRSRRKKLQSKKCSTKNNGKPKKSVIKATIQEPRLKYNLRSNSTPSKK